MSDVQWKINGIFKADVQKVDSEIKGIGKSATPQQVYEYAKENPNSELHKCFSSPKKQIEKLEKMKFE